MSARLPHALRSRRRRRRRHLDQVTPVDLAAAHEARVRREALREGARLVDLERSCREEHGAGPEQIGALLVAVSILRSEAKRIEGGGR